MRETDKFYFFWKHQLGQWTLRDIVDPESIVYNCCEQYMMYKKAKLFGDHEIAKQIMQEPDPAKQQKLGRQVKDYRQAVWNQNRVGIVWYGNYLKFTQHQDLREMLIATGNKILVEASPYDKIWGVGYRASDDQILDPKNWRGLNLLGETLMSVRSVLSLNELK